MLLSSLISASSKTGAQRILPPALFRARHILSILTLAALLPTIPAVAKNPEPALRIPLDVLGFQSISPRYLLSGGTMLTLHYVDQQHLLVTFGVSRLMPRLPDCPPEDEDRVVEAVLLELPSGRALARTEWRLHDIGQYLWPLANGTFLLRQRDTLTTFAPLASLATADPFQQHSFLHFDRRVDIVVVSADRDLLTIETSKPAKHLTRAEANALADAQAKAEAETEARAQLARERAAALNTPLTDPRNLSPATTPALKRHPPADKATDKPAAKTDSVQITFLRLAQHPDKPGVITPQLAGILNTSHNLTIPLTTDGFLRTRETSDAGVLLDFVTFAGKITDLGAFDTSCPPSPTFLNHSEFVTFGCRGSDDRLSLAGFNIHGDLMWQTLFSDTQAYPSFVSAIPAGRFAFSRTLTSSFVFPNETPSTDQLLAQEVRVLQTYNGKQLLRVPTSPIQRAGQNFALSPDGMALAVIHDPADAHATSDQHHPAIEIYKLPPLSGKDQQEVQTEAALAPAPLDHPTESPIHFTAASVKEAVADAPHGESAVQTDPQTALVPENTHIPPRQVPSTDPPDTQPVSPHESIQPASPLATPASTPSRSAADPANSDTTTSEPTEHRKPPSLYDYTPTDPTTGKPLPQTSDKPPQ